HPPTGALHPGRLDPGHHLAEPPTDLLDRMIRLALADGEEARAVRLVLEDPFARELARLDLAEDLPHLDLGLVAHDAWAAGVAAVPRGMGHGVAHVGEAPLVEEVDDELHLVHALEVGALGLIARFAQRLEGRLDGVRPPATERGLLA